MRLPLRTTAARQALAFGLLVVAAVSILVSAIYATMASALDRSTERQIRAEIQVLADIHRDRGRAALVEEVTRLGRMTTVGALYAVADENRHLLAGGVESWPAAAAAEGQDLLEFDLQARGAARMTMRPVRAAVRRLGDGALLLVGRDIFERRQFAVIFRVAMLAAIALLGALAAAMGYILGQRLTRRVQEAATSCESIMSGDLSRRLPVSDAHDEIDSLSASVNRMLDRLEELTRTRRAVFDSAAHDLRGPLYRLRNRIEVIIRRMRGTPIPGFDEALRDIDGIQRTLVMLLQIARAESGTPLVDVARFDLAALVRDLVELFEPLARQESLQLLHRATMPVPMTGNRQLVAQLASNLIENAVKYVPAGGLIVVSADRTEGGARLIVADNGPGIAEADRARAMQPFVRLEASQGATGSGLGLSLVAAIARLHGGQLSLEDNGPGLRVVVGFPAELPAATLT